MDTSVAVYLAVMAWGPVLWAAGHLIDRLTR